MIRTAPRFNDATPREAYPRFFCREMFRPIRGMPISPLSNVAAPMGAQVWATPGSIGAVVAADPTFLRVGPPTGVGPVGGSSPLYGDTG